MKQGISAALQFMLGFLLGMVILAGGAAAVGYLIFSRMASPPNKPIFAEELKEKTVVAVNKAKPNASTSVQNKDLIKDKSSPSTGDKAVDAKKGEQSPKITAQPSPSPSSPSAQTDAAQDKTPEKDQTLPQGAYKGKVTWSSGLSLRADPNSSASRVGGVDYNTELIILGTSQDGQWQKVRVANGTQEGWIKAGNIKKSSE
jgi:hypothetical protein